MRVARGKQERAYVSAALLDLLTSRSQVVGSRAFRFQQVDVRELVTRRCIY